MVVDFVFWCCQTHKLTRMPFLQCTCFEKKPLLMHQNIFGILSETEVSILEKTFIKMGHASILNGDRSLFTCASGNLDNSGPGQSACRKISIQYGGRIASLFPEISRENKVP